MYSQQTPIDDAALELIERGVPIVVCDGKVPLGGDNWHQREVTAQNLPGLLRQASQPAIGVKLGPGSVIDIEADSEDEESLFAKLFDGCEAPTTPTYKSRRGKHRLFQFDQQLSGLGRAVVNYSNGNGAKLGIRIGSDGKAAQSVIPPSAGREWIVSWDDVPPAKLPDKVVSRIIDAAQPKKTLPAKMPEPIEPGRVSTALADMLRIEAKADEADGSRRLLAVCCRAVEHNLTDDAAVEAARRYEVRHPFPIEWSDDDIVRRIRDAEQRCNRGDALVVPRHLTDYGNSERFAAQHGADVRYAHRWRKWLFWDGRRWAVDATGEVMRRAKRTARSIYVEASKVEDKEKREATARWASNSERRERLQATLALAESEQPIPVDDELLDAQPRLFNFLNGVVDLTTGELLPHQRDHFITKLCPLEYPTEPGADPELWLSFLDTICNGDKELIRFKQQLYGVALVGEVVEHMLVIFHGVGANGKSVELETISGAFGTDYAMAGSTGLLMANKANRHPTELADLHGKRLVTSAETADGGRLSEALLKQLTGGDTIRARRMREDNWQFRPSHTVIMATNHRPIVRGTDNGIWRRLKLVPFSKVIPEAEQDKLLAVKLRAEWPAIMRWCVAGCLDWQRNGLVTPAAVRVATEGYRADQDVLGEFVESECVAGPQFAVRATELYGRYKCWAISQGEFIETETRFGTRFGERGFAKDRDGSNRVCYRGVGLLPDSPDSPEGFSR